MYLWRVRDCVCIRLGDVEFVRHASGTRCKYHRQDYCDCVYKIWVEFNNNVE